MAEFQWSLEKTMTLIENIEAHPEIWNCALKEYRNRNVKAETIRVIAEAIGCNPQEVNRKFHNLRCQFNSELRKMNKKKSSDEGGNKKSTWEFFDASSFMTGNLKCVKTISSASLEHSVLEELEEIETNEETCNKNSELTPTSSSVPEIATEGTSTGPKKRKSNNMSLGSNFSNKEQQMLDEAVTVLRAPKDEFDVFGDFVAMELRHISSNEKRRRLKLKIQRAILEIGEEEGYSTPLSICNTNSNSDTASLMYSSGPVYQHLTPSTSTADQTTGLSNYFHYFNTTEPLPSENRPSTPHIVLGKPQE